MGWFALVCGSVASTALAVDPPAKTPATANLDLARQLNQAFVQVAEQVSPSVVVIKVVQKLNPGHKSFHGQAPDEETDPLDGLPPELREYFRKRLEQGQTVPNQGQGSGIILRENGFILTNAHVVEDADKIEVSLLDGRTFKAEVRGVDAPSDIAVIKIDAKGLPTARLADSSKVRVGEFAIAIGAPYALDYSVTFGHVSAKDRAGVIDPSETTAMMDQAFIQTDANINPGNSGGPLVNIEGEVIGVNALIRGLHTGIGFAVPINLAREVAEKIITDGKFTRAWLGIEIKALADYPEVRELLPDVKAGVVVRAIVPEGPAAGSKLRPGDVITAVEGQQVATVQRLRDAVRPKAVGKEITLDVYRKTSEKGGKYMKIAVKPGEWIDPAAAPALTSNGSGDNTPGNEFGIKVKALTPSLAKQLGTEITAGVVVSSVDRNSLAAESGIKPGDIITSINHQSISSPRQFHEAAKKASSKKGVMVEFISEGTDKFEVLKDGDQYAEPPHWSPRAPAGDRRLSMSQRPHILLIEDDASAAAALRRVLADEGYAVACDARGDTGLLAAQQNDFEVVITDLKLPGLNGLDLVRQLHVAKPRLPIILITAHGTTETAIEATKLGAYDYLLKPFEMEELLDLVGRAVASSRLMSQPVEMGEGLSAGNAIIGNSRMMQNIYKEIGRVAAKPVTVLIRGETGTGKELIARALYQHSDRSRAPFVAVNCAAIPETLLESELFGHERGAFTGAENRRIGRFEQANGGTLFLDEIGDLSSNTQAKLLRVLQEKYVHRLGGKEAIPIDARVIAATHRDLETALREKTFREDLYYRLSVVVIKVPALHQRAEDIPDLVRYFMQRHGVEFDIASPSIQTEAVQFLQAQPWPGNVRELENVVRQALLLAGKYTISLQHVQQVVAKIGESASAPNQSIATGISEYLVRASQGEMTGVHGRVIEEVERELFAQAIQMAQGNQARAARWLGVSRITMREKLHRFGLHPSGERTED